MIFTVEEKFLTPMLFLDQGTLYTLEAARGCFLTLLTLVSRRDLVNVYTYVWMITHAAIT